jgi:WD40 repeat protein
VIAGPEGLLVLWDLAARKRLFQCKSSHPVWPSAVVSADDKMLAAAGSNPEKAGDPGEVEVWEAGSGKKILTVNGHTDGVATVAFSPDSRTMASGASDRTVRLWDVATGKELHRLGGPDGALCCVSFSPDGRLLAATGWHTGVWLFDAHTGKQIRVLKCTSVCGAIAFSPDSKRLAASVDKDVSVRVWDIASGRPLLKFSGHAKYWNVASSLAFTPDGARIISCCARQAILWDSRSGKILWRWQQKDVRRRAVSSDGRWLAGQVGGKVRIWRLAPSDK